MKYFIIEESIDLDIIGEYPQVSPTYKTIYIYRIYNFSKNRSDSCSYIG